MHHRNSKGSAYRCGRALAALGLLLCGLPPAAASQAEKGDVDRGRALYQGACAGCHGRDGGGDRAWNAPRLAGSYDSYLMRQLGYFRDGIRGYDPADEYGWVMAGMVRSLRGEQAYRDVVAYIGTLEAPPAPPTLGGDPEAGKADYIGMCGKCHGSTGNGTLYRNFDPFPRLAGRHDWYMLRQLKLFKSGLRGAHEEDEYGLEMVRPSVQLEGEQQMLDIIAYIRTFQ